MVVVVYIARGYPGRYLVPSRAPSVHGQLLAHQRRGGGEGKGLGHAPTVAKRAGLSPPQLLSRRRRCRARLLSSSAVPCCRCRCRCRSLSAAACHCLCRVDHARSQHPTLSLASPPIFISFLPSPAASALPLPPLLPTYHDYDYDYDDDDDDSSPLCALDLDLHSHAPPCRRPSPPPPPPHAPPAAMDSPGTYPESLLDQDDVVYPCKGCGEILEEGKAFELGTSLLPPPAHPDH
jgi:hypothetical protein